MNDHSGAEAGSRAASSAPVISLPALLAETTGVQALGTLAVLTIPALAPEVAAALGVPTSHIGYQVAIVYFAAMVASLFGGTLVAAQGPVRTSQIAMVLAATGSVLASAPYLQTIASGSLIIGCAYGIINPAAAELLTRYSPSNRRNLIFSVKQAGVPLGGIVAGLAAPTLALASGWHAALWFVAAVCLSVAIALQPGRTRLDAQAGGARKRTLPLLASLHVVLSNRSLRWLALSSFCFSAVQLCLMAFLVALLVEDLGFSLVTAGMILAAVQTSSALGRIIWGYVADKVADGGAVLVCVALIMAAAAGFIVLFGNTAPAALVVLVLLVLGLSGAGWNGITLSEVARLSPPQYVGATTGAAMFFTFAGVVFGPAIFSQVHEAVGLYTRSYTLLVALSLTGALMIARARWRGPQGAQPSTGG